MTQVGRGSRLALRIGDRTVVLRVLADSHLDGDWSVPVLALAPGADDVRGDVDITTETGVVTLGARLVHDGGGLALCRAGDDVPARLQRRQDIRGQLSLPLRAAVLDPRLRQDLTDLAFHGATLDVSAGGLRVDAGAAVEEAEHLPAAARLFIELELPDDVRVPAVLSLVEPGVHGLRGTFIDIAAADRERLVRLVFAEERRILAARARARGRLPTDHLLTSLRRDPFSP